MKICLHCEDALTSENWYPSYKKRGYYLCKFCKKVKAREYYLKNKDSINTKNRIYHRENKEKMYLSLKRNRKDFEDFINRLKINGCAICGYDKCNASLEFHHVNPTETKFYIGIGAYGHPSNVFFDEFYKCILLCANCHKEIHFRSRTDDNGN